MPGQATDPTGLKILDAATRVLVDFGVRRATVELVAKYASVSHMTVYRRWPSKGDLLRSAVARELSVLVGSAFENATEAGSFDEGVRTAFGDVVWAVRNHPLVERELNTEPAVLLSLMSTGSGSVMETAVPMVAEQLRLCAGADTTSDELDALADVFVRLAHSLVLVQHPHHPLDTRADVADYVGRFFEPLTTSFPAVEADDENPVPPLRRMQRHRLQLAAASLLAVLLVGAGLTAVLVRQGPQPMPPDLIRTEQPSVPSASPAEPPAVPPVTIDPDPVVPESGPMPSDAVPAPDEQSPPTSAAPTSAAPAPTVRATISRGSTGGARAPGAGGPPRPPNPFPGGPPPMFSPPHPPSGAGPSGPGSGPGGPGPAGGPPH